MLRSAAMQAQITDSKVKPLSRNFSFHVLWSSTLASGFGDRLAMLTVMVLLGYNAAGTNTAAIDAGKDFFFFLPYVLWGPFAGLLADRLPRKWIMFASDQLRGLLILYAYTLIPPDFSTAAPESEHWKIWSLMFIIGFFAATFSPARTSVIPSVVGYRYLQRANAAVVSFSVVGSLIGFLVGGAIAEQSLRACVMTAALCYIVSGFFWIFLKTIEGQASESSEHEGNPIRQLLNGISYIQTHKRVRSLVAVSVVFWAGTQVVMAAVAVISKEQFEGGIGTYAFIAGAFGIGMLLGAMALGVLNTIRGGEMLLVVGLLGTGICLTLLVVFPLIWPYLPIEIALAMITGFFGGMLLITIDTMIQAMTPDRMRGRVFGAKSQASTIFKVVVAGLIWQIPGSNEWMFPATFVLSVILIVIALVGIKVYWTQGPMPTPFLNILFRFAKFYAFGFHRLQIYGKHNVPLTGPLLIVCNHTAGVDPFHIQAASYRLLRWIMLGAYKFKLANFFWNRVDPILVWKDERDRHVARAAIQGLKQGEAIVIFPEGGINQDRQKVDEFDAGVGLIVSRSKATVLPMWIWDTPKTRSTMGCYVVPSKSKIAVGKPFQVELPDEDPNEATDGRKSKNQRIADHIRERLVALRDSLNLTG